MIQSDRVEKRKHSKGERDPTPITKGKKRTFEIQKQFKQQKGKNLENSGREGKWPTSKISVIPIVAQRKWGKEIQRGKGDERGKITINSFLD